MSRRINCIGWLALLSLAGACPTAEAFFHLWRFTEFFSNADGSVQFIELHSTGSGETVAQGAEIRSGSTGKVFTFPTNLTGNTSNRNLLIATSGFGSLVGGVTPDFTLPNNFFNTAGDTVTLFQFQTIDTRTFSSVPTDGRMSRVYPSNSLAVNSPRNYAGSSGSVNLAAPSPTGDYNGNGQVDAADYVAWRNTLSQTVTAGQGADGSANGTIDTADYDFWRARFGNTTGPAAALGLTNVPEPATSVFALAGLLIHPGIRRHAQRELRAANP